MTEKLRLDIPVLLPGLPDSSDPCVERLLSELRGKEGVEAAHIKTANVDSDSQICVHYDPAAISLARIRELVTSTGAVISSRFGHVLWQLKGVWHERRARTVASQLRALPGVIEAEVSASGIARVEFDNDRISAAGIEQALSKRGLAPVEIGARKSGHADHEHREGVKDHAHGEGEGHEAHAHGSVFGPNTVRWSSFIRQSLRWSG
ncbi:hypothetical protein N6G05_25915 [Cupriavidus gilardii]|uniref:heavy-metal-associated domain-containing protein n=1 Tax=Cupriavidus gilardii TaxID=82541 RepID=UPI0021C2084F|nr:heavy metal-associated domain-containing protein [Cupriavidus gilardii]MCT9017004.1 hypothetical protein [Cupriavidus gilardii]MCT9056658.1 hypothetical protein [Cupriavidus gilardii]WNG68979.1 heavy metal-associated domain-containing protein [Cupriavidus gilardii]